MLTRFREYFAPLAPGHMLSVLLGKPSHRFSQSYYWSPPWQQGEKEADEDIRDGRVLTFDSLEEAFEWLDSDDEL